MPEAPNNVPGRVGVSSAVAVISVVFAVVISGLSPTW